MGNHGSFPVNPSSSRPANTEISGEGCAGETSADFVRFISLLCGTSRLLSPKSLKDTPHDDVRHEAHDGYAHSIPSARPQGQWMPPDKDQGTPRSLIHSVGAKENEGHPSIPKYSICSVRP